MLCNVADMASFSLVFQVLATMSATSTPSRSLKRQHSPPDNDLLCPICFELIREAHITRCGHTFCFSCISKCIELQIKCPKCSASLPDMNSVFPNFLLNDLVQKQKIKSAQDSDGLRDFVASESQNLSLPDVNLMLEVLNQRKHLLEAESSVAQYKLLYEFLKDLMTRKEAQLAQITQEVNLVTRDMKQVEDVIREVDDRRNKLSRAVEDAETAAGMDKQRTSVDTTCCMQRKRRLQTHFDDFVECFFTIRAKDLIMSKDNKVKHSERDKSLEKGLELFKENLVKSSRYSGFKCLATLNFSSDLFNNFTIVSSIEFDKDNEFFAISGVTKRIKVFDYNAVVQDVVDVHYPCVEMTSLSKISCVSWNSYQKNVLASSDYEGTVTVWDSSTGLRTKTYQEHEKRCWSVDFNDVDTRLIASGSDDAKVKLWSLNMEHSVTCIDAKANVCCVKFNPRSSCHLAFGSADHCVHYYDLRNTKAALAVFKGHRKAVSYVKFLNKEDIVSASTDSQLKLWNINKPNCLRSYVGHINDKNFVGLATDGDYVACGSENNSLYIYYKGLSKHMHAYRFDTVRSMLERERSDEDTNEFVSAVCWRPMSRVLVAANSQGIIKILELQG